MFDFFTSWTTIYGLKSLHVLLVVIVLATSSCSQLHCAAELLEIKLHVALGDVACAVI
jgi:hypothetical protein